MTALILGLAIFFTAHSVRIVADDWRSAQIARHGEMPWKVGYSLVSAAGFVLIVWGYGMARMEPLPLPLWVPPLWMRHLAALLTLPAFILMVAGYVPGTRIRAKVGHPMVAGVALWAFAHLFVNGRAAAMLLFGAFLVWGVLDYRAARARDRAAGVIPIVGPVWRDAVVVVAGLVAWAVFARFLHGPLIGVRPFG